MEGPPVVVLIAAPDQPLLLHAVEQSGQGSRVDLAAGRDILLHAAVVIKTSTGFGTNGATLEDIKLMKQNVSKDVAIKAAGGVRTIEDAENFIKEGAIRLGTSSICQVLKNQQVTGY